MEGGIIDRATALKELRQSSEVTGVWTNITDEQIEEAENEPPPHELALQAAMGQEPFEPGAGETAAPAPEFEGESGRGQRQSSGKPPPTEAKTKLH
jgi:hypothetical protein